MKGMRIYCVLLAFCASISPAAGEVELPEGFKEVVPVYPGATVTMSMKVEDGAMAQMETAAEPEAVLNFYKKKLSGEGWKTEMEMALPNGRTIVLKKGERMISVMAMGADGGTTRLHITLGKD